MRADRNPTGLSARELNRMLNLTSTVEIVSLGTNPGYRVGGVVQAAGDRSRCAVGDARHLEATGKARIVPNSEKDEML
jgi:hypothetical protein